MPHRVPWSAVVGLLASLSAGCVWLPVANGPTYAWQAHFPPAGPEAGIEALVDARPDWERQYRALLGAPGAWRKAVGFIPAENVRPSPLDSLAAVAHRAAGTAPGVEAVTVRLTSFRIIVNDVEFRRQQHEEQLDEAEAHRSSRFHFGLAVSSDAGTGFGPGADFASDAPIHRRLGGGSPPPRDRQPVEPLFMRDYQIVHGEREYFGPPAELPQRYEAGATCEIAAQVEVCRSGGVKQTFDVRAERRVAPSSEGATDVTVDVPPAVAGAIDEFAAQVQATLDGSPQPR